VSASQRRAGCIAGLAIGLLLALPALASAAPPQIAPSLSGAAGANGWYVGPVTVKWSLSGTITPPTTGCDPETLMADTPGVQLTCTASNDEGSTTSTTKAIKIDQTPPVALAAAPARPPDRAPWYVSPLAITWSGGDATSGIAACTALTYGGPDGAAAAPAGTCRDNAGNVSAPVPFGLAYDATPPALTGLAATVSGTAATVHWTAGADTQDVTVVRRPGDKGAADRIVTAGAPGATGQVTDGPLTRGATYTWAVTVRDAAGNGAAATTTATVPATTDAASKKPKKAAARLPTLRWRARPGAKYYNLQLFRNGHKILSAWPTVPRYTLHAAWKYRGQRHRLVAGHYRWYAWAGYGARNRHHYGKTPIRGTVTIPAVAK
jgi:xanthosine utilization system XapX-like protein